MVGPAELKYAIRLLHTLAAAYVVGGALLLWAGWPPATTAESAVPRRYERGFWIAIGLLTATGVGNLAAFSGGVPGPDSPWGSTLLLKLAAVALLLVLSVWRTLAVARAHDPAWRRRTLRPLYGATALGAGLTFSLAVRLAHP